jgi:hypothetical protein
MSMRRYLTFLLVTWLAASSVRATDDQIVAARSAALDLAGAFSANDGYKLRDGYFATPLKAGDSKIFAVHLYSGNSYWFCVATAPAAKKIDIALYDEMGKPLPMQPYADGSRAAAGLTAVYSGSYYIKISLSEGNGSEDSTACLLYAYK